MVLCHTREFNALFTLLKAKEFFNELDNLKEALNMVSESDVFQLDLR